ncbi:AAA-domain-containing protein [Ramaria rubella]|nr:AAA-domain-containing protein [Ramaria rubella]
MGAKLASDYNTVCAGRRGMRSQAIFCRSRSVLKPWPYTRNTTSSSALASSRKPLNATPAWQGRSHTRNLSSTPSPPDPTPSPPPEENEEPKPKPRGRTKRSSEKPENAALPPNLNILWSPDGTREPLQDALPPPELLQEALNNLLITLHPQTQHRATYNSQNGSPIEPTLAIYCPIEGGDYVVDETIRELARRTRAEVVVLDTIEIAAGEWGAFGKAAAAIHLPENPLHLSSSPSPSSLTSSPPSPITLEQDADDSDESSGPHIILSASPPFPFSQLGVPISRTSRSGIVLSRRSPLSKAKAFFDDIVNMPSPTVGESTKDSSGSPSSTYPPRIIYIRDYSTLAPSKAIWFSSLVASVRSHRQGPLARPTSPILNPTTIVLGITPPIFPPMPSTPSNPGTPTALLRFLMNRQSQSFSSHRSDQSKHSSLWDESETAQNARDRRLRDRLRNWEAGDPNFYVELPEPPSMSDHDADSNSLGTGIIIAGPGGQPFGSSIVASRQSESSKGDDNDSYFRLSVVVPRTRTAELERESRIARRRHINELVVRMAVGSIGGVLLERFDKLTKFPVEKTQAHKGASQPADPERSLLAQEALAGHESDLFPEDNTVGTNAKHDAAINAVTSDMWNDWGQRVEVWTTVKEIADRAVGSVVASSDGDPDESSVTLDPTPIPWSAVHSAWISQRNSRSARRAWIEESSGRASGDEDLTKTTGNAKAPDIDEVIERVKQDADLDQHETRLLGCIVDSSSMTTTFNQVHLPSHTIDSVRTLVSLPLLHPQAFSHGILKQHTMTGALLFGPPGTGKTLVVRALAKESGARMLIIKPSDVMDMYVGEGEKLVRSVFSLARRLSPCVVFLDELDALFGARVSTRETGGAIAHRGVITEFMQEMDGLKTSRDSNVIVIGATNRPFDLDDAVLRRLPRRLLVDLPGVKEREEILKILLRDENLTPEVDLGSLARRTESFSGSDLKHLCVSAALDAVKERVTLPWSVPRANATPDGDLSQEPTNPSGDSEAKLSSESSTTPSTALRILSLSNFAKALNEITPSASESLGTLSDLRKWNEEFGEGGRQRKRRMWGGRFGFSDRKPEGGEGKVNTTNPPG